MRLNMTVNNVNEWCTTTLNLQRLESQLQATRLSRAAKNNRRNDEEKQQHHKLKTANSKMKERANILELNW